MLCKEFSNSGWLAPRVISAGSPQRLSSWAEQCTWLLLGSIPEIDSRCEQLSGWFEPGSSQRTWVRGQENEYCDLDLVPILSKPQEGRKAKSSPPLPVASRKTTRTRWIVLKSAEGWGGRVRRKCRQLLLNNNLKKDFKVSRRLNIIIIIIFYFLDTLFFPVFFFPQVK